jgi:hypothetical protein
VVLRSHDITVTNNHFFNPSLAWISVSLEHESWYYAEGPASYDIDIKGNRFEGGTNLWNWSAASIGIQSHSYGKGIESPSYDSFNVLIESNAFINIDGPAVKATSARDVGIFDNFVHVGSGIKAASQPTVLLSNANDIQMDGLDIHDLNPATYAAVHIMETVPSAPGAVTITNLSTELAIGSAEILDER